MRRRGFTTLAMWVALGTAVACEDKLDERQFRRRAEQAFTEVHPGFSILKREPGSTIFVRGDQLDRLEVGSLFADYQASGEGASDFLDRWTKRKIEEAAARRRTLESAKDDIIPILKSKKWIEAQDLGAIGPSDLRDKIRPWRTEIAPELYAILGVPEEKLGYRFASIQEVEATKGSDAWLDLGVKNLTRMVGTATGAELRGEDGALRVLDMKNVDGVSAMILDPKFRMEMVERFQMSVLGAAVPIRNVLIVFDPSDFTTLKPIRARTHQLYDTQNHPGFRGLLRIDRHGVTVLEGAD